MSSESSQPKAKARSLKAEVVALSLLALFWYGPLAFFVADTVVLPAGRYIHAKRTYTVTNGTVLSSSVKSGATGDGGSCGFAPAIEYSYTVRGKEYTSDQFGYSKLSRNKLAEVEAIVDQYSVGSEVPVYFSPDDPQKSVLSIQRPYGVIFLACFQLPFILVGMGPLLAVFHYRRQARRLAHENGSMPVAEQDTFR